MGRIGTVLVGVGDLTLVGDDGCVIVLQQEEVGQLGADAGGDVHDAEVPAAVQDAHDAAVEALRVQRCRSGIGPQPGGIQVAVIGDLIGVGVNAIHVVAVVDEDVAIQVAAGQELLAALAGDGPVLGLGDVEADPLALTLLVVQQTAQLQVLDVSDGDGAGSDLAGLGNGGGDDEGLADADGSDAAVLVNGDDALIVAGPGDALVHQVPGEDIGLELAGSAGQQLKVFPIQGNAGGIIGGGHLAGVLGNHVKAAVIADQAAQGVLGNIIDGVGSAGSLAGGGVDGVKDVVGADRAHCGGVVQDVVVMVPGHRLNTDIAHVAHVVVVDVVAQVAVSGVVDGSQVLDVATVGAVSIAPTEQECASVVGITIVDGVEVALVINGHGQQLVVGIVGAAGEGQGNGVLLHHVTVGQIDGVDVVCGADQGIHGTGGGIIGHVLDLGVILALAHQVAGLPVALLGGVELAVGGGHEDVAAGVLGCDDGPGHGGLVDGAVHVDVTQVIGVVVELVDVDLSKAVGVAAGQLIGKAVHPAAEVVDALVVILDGVEGLVAGVVGNHHDTVTVDGELAHIHLGGDGLTGLGLLSAHHGQDIGALGVQNGDGGDVVVVGGVDDQVAGLGILLDGIDHGSLAVHGEGVTLVSALADGAGGHQSLHSVDGQGVAGLIELGYSHQTDGEPVAVLKAHLLGGGPDAQTDVVDVHPGGVSLVVVGSLELVGAAGVNDVALAVQDIEHEAGGVTDQGNGHIAELGLGVQGSTVSGEGILDEVGVADEEPLVDAIEQGQVVQTTGVGEDVVVIGIVGVVRTVIHAGVGPVAVEAQHGDGLNGIDHALCVSSSDDLHEALDVAAVDIVSEGILVGQLHHDLDMDLLAGSHSESSGLQGGQDQVCVKGVDLAVAVQVSLGVDGGQGTGGMLQNHLGIGGIGQAVAVQIAVQSGADGQVLAAHGVGGSHGKLGGVLAVIGNAVELIQLLGEEVTGQGVGLLSVRDVVDGEAEGVGAGLLGIVTQLGLDLAVGSAGGGVLIHQNVGTGGDGVGHIGQTAALLQDGIVAADLGINQRLGGTHQQAGGQRAGAHAGLLSQTVLTDVLHDQGGHTGDLGSGHGSAGQVHVGVAGLDLAVDGVDVAAGSGDLGLDLQVAGNTPGAIGAHGDAAGAGGGDDLVGDVHGALVQTVAHVLAGGLQEVAVSHGDGDTGARADIVGQIHVQNALGVVGDDTTGKTGIGGVVALLEEADLATEADHDGLGGIVHQGSGGGSLLSGADVVDQDIVIVLAADGIHTVDVSIVDHTAGVEEVAVGDGQVVIGGAQVLNGGHGQGVGGGGRAADDGEVHIVAVQGGHAVAAVVCPGTGVTGGDGHDGVRLGQAVQDVLVGLASGEALVGAQGQVDHITAEHDGVLDGDHVVGVVSAAHLAEDLHDEDLGIGGDTLGLDGLHGGFIAGGGGDEAVGGGDTGDMGAVAALAVAIVGDLVVAVNVVDGEGHLCVDVPGLGIGQAVVLDEGVDVELSQDLLHIHHVQQIQALDVAVGIHALLSGLLLQCIAESACVEALMVGVQTGVDDSDAAAGAGVAGGPGGVGADHAGGIGLQRLSGLDGQRSVLLLNDDLLDARNGCDLIDAAVGNVGGDDVAGQGQVPDHIQLLTGQGTLLDDSSDLCLLLAQGLSVVGRIGVGGNALGGELLQDGLVSQDDGDTDVFRFRVLLLLVRMLHGIELQLDICVNAVDLLDGELMAGLSGSEQISEAPGISSGTHAEHHAQHEHHRQYSNHRVSHFHFFSSF